MSTYAPERAVADARPPRAFLSRVAAAGLPASPRSTEPLTEADPDGLPPEAIRYLRAMLGKAVGLVAVADGSGPEFDLGELTTWLDDAVLLAPGMLLDARTSWAAAGERSSGSR